MQRIERYGVIALVFLLVTILAVSLWGESKGDGFFSMFKSKKPENAKLERPLRNRPQGTPLAEQPAGERMLPLASGETAPNAQGTAQPGAQPQAPAQPMATPDTLTQLASHNAATPPNAQGVATDPNAALRGPNVPLLTSPGGAQQPPANALNAPLATPSNALVRNNVPATPATREYKVKSGDTLGEIASHELGSSARWVDIQRLNKMIEPSKLKVGMTLQLPVEQGAVAANTNAAPSTKSEPKIASSKPSSSGRKYVVKSGDSLSGIASAELGSAARWTEIRDLNPGLDANRLVVGASLAMPAGATASKAKESSNVLASANAPATPKKKSGVK